MNTAGCFNSRSSKKHDLSDYKKRREGSLNDSLALNSTALEDVFTGSLQ